MNAITRHPETLSFLGGKRRGGARTAQGVFADSSSLCHMSLQDEIVAELQDAMKAGDVPRRDALRQIQTEVAKAKAEPGYAGEVDDDLYLQVIASYVRKMRKVREEYTGLGDRGRDQAEKLGFEIEFLGRWLPQSLGEDETRAVVAEAIAELGVEPDPGNAGRVIGHIMKSGREGLDGALVNKLVREQLGAG